MQYAMIHLLIFWVQFWKRRTLLYRARDSKRLMKGDTRVTLLTHSMMLIKEL